MILKAPNRTPNVPSGARHVVFEMVLHDVTSVKLEVKEMNVIQF